MATIKQLEKMNGGEFPSDSDFYCLMDCPRCATETEPFNGHFLFQREDGTWFCPWRAGYKTMDFDCVNFGSFGATCARKALAAGGKFERVKPRWQL